MVMFKFGFWLFLVFSAAAMWFYSEPKSLIVSWGALNVAMAYMILEKLEKR